MKNLLRNQKFFLTWMVTTVILSGCGLRSDGWLMQRLCAGVEGYRPNRIQCSPDGNRVLLADWDEVGTADLKGNFTKVDPAVEEPVDWMPDSQSFLCVTRENVKTWDELQALVREEEEDLTRVRAAAELCAKLAEEGKTYDSLTETDHDMWEAALDGLSSNHVYYYLQSTNPEAFKKWSGGSDKVAGEVTALSVRTIKVGAPLSEMGQALFRDAFYIHELAVSPRGDAVAMVLAVGNHSRLVVISTKQPTQKSPAALAFGVSDVDWIDNEKIVFIRETTGPIGSSGELTTSVVLDSDGNPVKQPKTRVLAKLGFDSNSRVNCTSDGIFFYGPAKEIYNHGSEDIEFKLLKVIPNETPVIVPILTEHFSVPNSGEDFQVSPDGKHIAFVQRDGTVDVLDTAGGATVKAQDVAFDMEKLQHERSRSIPKWRTADELCFVAPKKDPSGRRAAALVLWSLSKKTSRDISANWPEDGAAFLNDVKIKRKNR